MLKLDANELHNIIDSVLNQPRKYEESEDDYRFATNYVSEQVQSVRNERIDIDSCLKLKEVTRNRIKTALSKQEKDDAIKNLFSSIESEFGTIQVNQIAQLTEEIKQKPKKIIHSSTLPQLQSPNYLKPLMSERVPSPTEHKKDSKKITQKQINDLCKRQNEWLQQMEMKHRIGFDLQESQIEILETITIPKIQTNWLKAKEQYNKNLEKELDSAAVRKVIIIKICLIFFRVYIQKLKSLNY